MGVSQLLNELSRKEGDGTTPVYAGTDAQILAKLNQEQQNFRPVLKAILSQLMTDLAIVGTVELARTAGQVNNVVYARWLSLRAALADPNILTFDFSAAPLNLDDMFKKFGANGVIDPSSAERLRDLGSVRTTRGRKVWNHGDITQAVLDKVRALDSLAAKVKGRREAVKALHQEAETINSELEKQAADGTPIGNPAVVIPWEV